MTIHGYTEAQIVTLPVEELLSLCHKLTREETDIVRDMLERYANREREGVSYWKGNLLFGLLFLAWGLSQALILFSLLRSF
jgi:hypothetical protein